MHIYTLGTSHGSSTFCRFNSCTVYETTDGALYMVDAGAPAEALLRRKGLELSAVRAVFITHLHDDHAGGLSSVIKQTIKHQKQRTQPLALYLPEKSAAAALKQWMFALHVPADDPIVDYRTIDDGILYEDDNLTVTAIRTKHLRTVNGPYSFAFILHFAQENVTVLHTGDLHGSLVDYPAIAFEQDFDVCVAEATHYDPAIAAPLFARSRFGRLILSHIHDPWHIRVADDGTVDNGEERLLDYYRDLPYPVCIAHDGEDFDI